MGHSGACIATMGTDGRTGYIFFCLCPFFCLSLKKYSFLYQSKFDTVIIKLLYIPSYLKLIIYFAHVQQYMRGSRKFYQRGSSFDNFLFLVDERIQSVEPELNT